MFEGKVYHILVHHVQLFYSAFEGVVLLVPVRCLHIQDFVLLVSFELIYQLYECSFDLQKNAHNFGSTGSSEPRELIVSSFQGELQLALTNLNEF